MRNNVFAKFRYYLNWQTYLLNDLLLLGSFQTELFCIVSIHYLEMLN